MATLRTDMKRLYFPIFTTICLIFFFDSVSANRELDENNWKDILEGEWMVEFYAPWCPACNALAPAWQDLHNRAKQKSLKMKTAAVDVTKSPGLSGRFMVTALPTIFHVIKGEFRQYKGPRDTDSMLEFVVKEKWRQLEAMPGWKAPDSVQMGLVAEFFKLSQALRSIHNMLMETYGLPTWGSYLIFSIGIIFIGALLGLMLVCLIDLVCPPRRVAERKAQGDARVNKTDDQELLNEDLEDDADQLDDSDAEKNSPSDTSEEEGESEKRSVDQSKGDEGGDRPAVRKRRPRHAD